MKKEIRGDSFFIIITRYDMRLTMKLFLNAVYEVGGFFFWNKGTFSR